MLKTRNLFNLDKNKIKNTILLKNPSISDIEIKKIFPNSIQIKIILRSPTVAIISNNRQYLVDDYGYVIKETGIEEDWKLLKIYTLETVVVGQKIVSPSIYASINLEKLCSKSDIIVQNIKVNDLINIVAEISSDLVVYFNGSNDLEKQIDSLKYIFKNLEQLEPGKQMIIDLRYNDPIVKSI